MRERVQWKQRHDELARLVADGATTAEIAAHFGCEQTSVRTAMMKASLVLMPEAVHRGRSEAARLKMKNDPAFRARRVAQIVAINQSPDRKEWLRERGRFMQREYLSRPDVKARSQNPKKYVTRRETVLAHIPPRWREEYLRHTDKMTAAERLELVMTLERKRIAGMTAFERLCEAVERGELKVSNKPTMPPHRDYDYTLGGVSADMM